MEFTEFEHNDNWKMKRFPCSCCLVNPACNDHTKCDLLQRNAKKIFKLIQDEKKCPDCGELLPPLNVIKYNIRCNDCEHLFKISYNHKMAWRDNDRNIPR